jgi:hypothetical protein
MSESSARPASAPETSPEFPSFEEFREQMKPALTQVQRRDIDGLLRGLYQIAKRKNELEGQCLEYQAEAARSRSELRRMRRLRTVIRRVVKLLEKAGESPGELKLLMDWWYEPPRCGFEEILRFLRDSLVIADELEAALAVTIHPRLRNRTENTLRRKLDGRPRVDDPIFGASVLPARDSTPTINRLCVYEAEKCLDEYRTGTGDKLSNYDNIIATLFRVAFGKTRPKATIRQQFSQQKKKRVTPVAEIPLKPRTRA